jgi:hypothetical protein
MPASTDKNQQTDYPGSSSTVLATLSSVGTASFQHPFLTHMTIRDLLHPWDQYLIRGNHFFSLSHIGTFCSTAQTCHPCFGLAKVDGHAPLKSE